MKKILIFILWFLIAGCAMNYTIPVLLPFGISK